MKQITREYDFFGNGEFLVFSFDERKAEELYARVDWEHRCWNLSVPTGFHQPDQDVVSVLGLEKENLIAFIEAM